jgi:hypothetical protein
MTRDLKAHHPKLTPTKTYALKANVVRAVEKFYGPNEDHFGSADVRHVVVQGDDLRWFPIFIGQSALEKGAHHHFCVAM